MEENKFDFKFLNKVMYGVAFLIGVFALQQFGLLAKIGEILAALTPFYIGVVICWISRPIANRLRKLGLGKGISAIISLLIIFGIVSLALSYIIPITVTQVTQLIKDLPSIYYSAVEKINAILAERFAMNYQITTTLGELGAMSNITNNILGYSLDTAQAVGSALISVVTAIMISFFMVKDVDRSKNSLIVFLSKNSKDSNRYKMLKEMDEIINSYVRGLLIDSLLVGIMTTIVCMVLKLKYAVIFGVLITFLNLIPYIGAFISHAIISIYAYTVGGPIFALIALACSFGVQLIDANILQPNIIAKSIKIHPVVVICGLLVFERLFGVIGMVIAMPVIALFKIFIKYQFGVSFDPEEDDIKGKRIIPRRVRKPIDNNNTNKNI